jgi:hypothetical protein
VVEVSTNGGTTWADVGEANFLKNGYTHTLDTCCSNPLPGRKAFSGASDWVQSQVDLSGLAGDNVQVRFRVGSDNLIGTTTGWFVDDVEIGEVVETTSEGTAEAATVPSYDLADATTRIVEPVLTVPDAPSVTGSTPSAGAVSVAFTPGDDGGSPITGYTSECVSTDGGVTNTGTGAASPISVSGLSAGKSYHCRVLATNAVGNSPYSGFGATVLVPAPPPVATIPGKPVVTDSKAVSKKKAKISFILASDGGSPVTSYKVTCASKNGGKKRSATGPASPIKVKKLTPGKTYKCKVRATNAVGVGPWSKKGKKFTMPNPREAVAPRLFRLP